MKHLLSITDLTRADIERALRRTTRRDVTPLLRAMVDGRWPAPYDSVLAFAGYRLERTDRQLPALGMIRRTTPSPFGIAHGITFGDGHRNGSGSIAQLDPVKDAQLLEYKCVEFVEELMYGHLRKEQLVRNWQADLGERGGDLTVQIIRRPSPSVQ